jgi:hypothetical protein
MKNETTSLPGESSADACRRLGFKVGTRLAGDEGYGVCIIEITAIGERRILAKEISHGGQPCQSSEGIWTLDCRRWLEIPKA